jgi:hypothetical protein
VYSAASSELRSEICNGRVLNYENVYSIQKYEKEQINTTYHAVPTVSN